MASKRRHLLAPLLLLLAPMQGASSADPLQDVTLLRWVARQGHLEVIAEGGQTVYRFDHKLRWMDSRLVNSDAPQEPTSMGSGAAGQGQELEIRGPGGRVLRWRPEAQILQLSKAPWENAGTVEWGPGWATIEFRSSRHLGPWLVWMDAQGVQHLVPVHIDPRDPTRQRAYLRNLSAGKKIRLRHKPLDRRFPARAWTDWVDLEVPEVDPSGLRPTSELPE